MNFNPSNFPADVQPVVEELTTPAIKRVTAWLQANEHAPLTALAQAYDKLPQLQSLDPGLRHYIWAQAMQAYMEAV